MARRVQLRRLLSASCPVLHVQAVAVVYVFVAEIHHVVSDDNWFSTNVKEATRTSR